jgi:hypothetical protein
MLISCCRYVEMHIAHRWRSTTGDQAASIAAAVMANKGTPLADKEETHHWLTREARRWQP